MNRGKAPLVSLCERKFILEAIKENKRVDGRESYDYREMKISLSKEPGNVEVTLGRTRVLACVSCQVIEPRPQQPTEGILYFNVELSPMASPAFEAGKQSSLCVEITRLLERCQKESRAVDTESLCIIAGQKVWEIRIDLHVLDHCGNIIDCAAIAAITALKHFRRPDVTVVGEEATIHPVSERDPVPLSVHHIPVCFTFAFFWEGEYLLVDPSLEEEQVMDGKLVVGMNIHREICVLQMIGGVAILPEQVKRCIEIAAVKCVEITEIIKCALAGKKVDPSLGYESILHNQRKEQAVDVSNSPVLIEDDEPMQQDPPLKKEKIDYLGPGTARLVGMGGDNTWEAINSLTDASDEDDGDAMQTDTKAAEAMEPVAVGREKEAEIIKDSDSEEEETMLLTGADMASSAVDSKQQKQEDDDDDVILLDSPPSKTPDSRETSESVEGSLESADMRTSSNNTSASARSKKKRRGAGGGGGDGAAASPADSGSNSASGGGRPKRNAKGKGETVTATVSKKKGRGKKK